MSGTTSTNQLQQPLGAGVPLPGGQLFPAQRRSTLPAMNRMTAGGAGQAPGLAGNVPSMGFNQSRRTLGQEFSRNQNALREIQKALRKMDAVRKSLGGLAEKQDTVTMDDVVHEAGKLVGHGIDPLALAGVLADAPQEGGGEALAAWVAGHAQAAEQGEMQMMQQRDLLNHRAGVNAMHLLMAHDNAQAMFGGGEAPENDLVPGGGPPQAGGYG